MVREWRFGGSRYGPDGEHLGPVHAEWNARQGEPDSDFHAGSGQGALSVVVEGRLDTGNLSGLLVRLWGCRMRIGWASVMALEIAPLQSADTVQFDLVLPRRNGLRIARHLRRKAGFTNTDLIAMQGDEEEPDFDLHLVKTLTPGELRELLAAVEDNILATAQ
jgi:CheY-like chemotaxis protein